MNFSSDEKDSILKLLEKELNETWIPQLGTEGKQLAAERYVLDAMAPIFQVISMLKDKELVETIIKTEVAHILAQITRRLEIPDSLLRPGDGVKMSDRVYDILVDEVKSHFRDAVNNN